MLVCNFCCPLTSFSSHAILSFPSLQIIHEPPPPPVEESSVGAKFNLFLMVQNKAHYLTIRQLPVFKLYNYSVYSDIINLQWSRGVFHSPPGIHLWFHPFSNLWNVMWANALNNKENLTSTVFFCFSLFNFSLIHVFKSFLEPFSKCVEWDKNLTGQSNYLMRLWSASLVIDNLESQCKHSKLSSDCRNIIMHLFAPGKGGKNELTVKFFHTQPQKLCHSSLCCCLSDIQVSYKPNRAY